MNISVSGKNMNTGTAFQVLSKELLTQAISKYFTNAISGHVTLVKSDAGFDVKVRVNLTNRIELESRGSARDANVALEEAIEHAEKRLRRHKRRLRNHRNPANDERAEEILSAPLSVYASANQLDQDKGLDDENTSEDVLPVIAELSYDVEQLTVEQAVMRLELSGENALMFRNGQHAGLNMVYLRSNGTIGWVDPRGARQLKH